MGDAAVDALARRAVAWALNHVGSTRYAGRCLGFVEDAYERSNAIEVFGGDSATTSAELYGVQPIGRTWPPPGAFVFYACSGPIHGVTRPWGHVGLSLGNGHVVHAWDRVRVDPIEGIEHLPLQTGWTAPRLSGWTSPQRVLRDHRTRSWGHG
jgi:cell wall-associated NlpC family hydrolase